MAVEPWGGFVPEQVDLTRTDRALPPAAPSRSFRVGSASAGRVQASVGPGEAALLSLPQNANSGWTATLDGRRLDPVTVDGWKQGFVVPQGVGGPVVVAFGPDRLYRWGLLAGLALVLLVAGSALRRSAGRAEPLRPGSGPTVLIAPAAVVLGFALAGWWGLAVAGGCVAGAVLLGQRPRWPLAAAVVGLVTVAGVVQAALAPGRLGEPAVEGTVRLLCVAALVLVVTASWRAPRPSGDAPPAVR